MAATRIYIVSPKTVEADQCPRSGSYTGPAFVETTLPATEGEREALLWSAA